MARDRSYILPTKSGLKESTTRVLSFDPGSVNFGLSVVATKGLKAKVVANAILMRPMNKMNRFEVQKKELLEEIGNWVDLYKPQALIAERFMLRGVGTGGAVGELVPSMIALVSGYFRLNTLTIPAAQWKVPTQNRFDIDLKEEYKKVCVEAHQLDASLIGIYGLEKGLRTQLNLKFEDILKQVEDSSLVPLINRRRR